MHRLLFFFLLFSSCQLLQAPCFSHDPICQPWGPLLFSSLSTSSKEPLENIYYVTTTGSIYRLHRDGADSAVLRTGISMPVSVARDDAGGVLFWTDNNNDVWKQDSSGSSLAFSQYYGGMYYHSANGYLYANQAGGNELVRSRIDGSDYTSLNTNGSGSEHAHLIVDSSATYAYFTTGPSNSIRRMTLDASNVYSNLVLGLLNPAGICVDFDAGFLYWVERAGNRLQRANLDGSNVTLLLGGLNDPVALGCDFASGLLYIGEETGARLLKVDLSGNILATLVQTIQIRDLVPGR